LTSDEVIRIENIVTNEILIDTEAGKRTCKCTCEKPSFMSMVLFDEWKRGRDLKMGDVVEFTL